MAHSIPDLIEEECNEIKDLLLRKNLAYGNSAFEPINIFSPLQAIDQINVRIDDKLNRIKKGQHLDAVPEDTILDLIGYLILRRIVVRL